MRRFWTLSLICIYVWIMGMTIVVPASDCAAGVTAEGRIYIIPVKGEITPAMAVFLKEQIGNANQMGAKGILIEITTFGGRVDAAIAMKDAILGSKVPVTVYIGERAVSAGALITIAAYKIVMAPGSHIGSAEPIPYSEKSVAVVRSEFQTTAKRRGRDEQIAGAMVDKFIEVPGLSPTGSLLDMDADTAREYGYADAVLEGRKEVLKFLDSDEASMVEVVPSLRVRIAQFLTRSEVASILLIIGMIAILAEFFTQGFGVAGVVGIGALALYFGGSFLAGYGEWWSIALFLIGSGLLTAEIFVPGFGILGIGGLTAMVVGLTFAAPDPIRGMKYVGIAMIVALMASPLLFRLLGRIRAFDRLILSETVIEANRGDVRSEGLKRWIGKTGFALTTLRPSGSVEIDGEKVDVVSNGEFLMPGTKIRVIKVMGASVIVTRDE